MQDQAVVGVDTSKGTITAGTVVLAAGTGVATLCMPLGVDLPVASSPAVLMRVNAPPGAVRTLVSSPEVEARQTADGLLLAAEAYAGETDHHDLRHSAHGTRQRLEKTFDARLVDVRVGMRPMPADGLPIVGPLPARAGAYIAVMHSAVSLAPVAGRLIAAEVLHGRHFEELQLLRPDRFADGT